MPRERSDEPTPLIDVLRAALAQLPSELREYELWGEWESVVGPALARHARPTQLRRGVLFVAVDAAEWMHELQYLKQQVRDRLNERLGRQVVRDVSLVFAADR